MGTKGIMIDLTGKRFGRWTVICRALSDSSGNTRWFCKCECGSEKVVHGGGLKFGDSQSCGCLKIAKMMTHGLRGTPEYSAWDGMIQRCSNPENPEYFRYGGRGITVCQPWEKFENFFSDMGKRPGKRYSIDRRENNKGYSPENCRWTTPNIQMRNSRTRKDNTSGFRGVARTSGGQRYQAYIYVDQKRIYLGSYANISNAVAAREAGVAKYWGKAA